MNYKLSVYADRIHKKSGYVLLLNGSVLAEKVMRFRGDNIKENALSALYNGLLACKSQIHHNDVVVIEVQNQHLCNWLNGLVEYDGYADYLDKVFSVLEMFDCRYSFYFSKDVFAKKYISDKSFTSVKVGTIDDMMSDFE